MMTRLIANVPFLLANRCAWFLRGKYLSAYLVYGYTHAQVAVVVVAAPAVAAGPVVVMVAVVAAVAMAMAVAVVLGRIVDDLCLPDFGDTMVLTH